MSVSTLLRARMRLCLEAEVTVEWPPAGFDPHLATLGPSRALLDAVMADPIAKPVYLRQVAAMPFADWTGGAIETDFGWLDPERRQLARVIGALAPEDQAAFRSVLRGETDDELDAFLAAFKVRYLALTWADRD